MNVKLFFNTVSGFVLGLMPLAAGVILSFVFYISIKSIWVYVIIGLIMILSLFGGYVIFKRVRKVGLIRFLTAIHASSDLDNLQPTSSSQVFISNFKDYADVVGSNRHLCRRGRLGLFGEDQIPCFQNFVEIKGATYKTNTLTLIFTNGTEILFVDPGKVYETDSYLKIQHAKEVHVIMPDEVDEQNRPGYIKFVRSKSFIDVDSNVNSVSAKNLSLSLGEPVLFIAG